MTKFEEMLAKAKEAGVSDDLITEFVTERTAKNEADKDKRKTNTKIIKDLMEQMGLEDKSEVVEKVSGSSNEIRMLQKQMDEMKLEKEQDKKDLRTSKLSGKISDILTAKKVKTNATIKAGLLAQVKETEDGNGLLVGDQSLEDYIQKEFIDGVETITNNKLKKETQQTLDTFTSDELDALTEVEMANSDIMAKVDRSMKGGN